MPCRNRSPRTLSGRKPTLISTNSVLPPRPCCVSRCAFARRVAYARIFWGVRSCAESELPQRTAERVPSRIASARRNQISPGSGDQVSISCAEGRGDPSGAGVDPADLPRPGCSDRERARRQEPRAPSHVHLLESALLGPRIFLRDEQPGNGGADSRLHRRSRPGAARFGFYAPRVSFRRLSVVPSSIKSLDFHSRVVAFNHAELVSLGVMEHRTLAEK